MFKEHKKITVGFVVQTYYTSLNGDLVCHHQKFVAGDSVDYENMEGEPITIDTDKEVYCPKDMKQPKQIGTDGVKFVCPSCGDTHLECIMDGCHASDVLNIDEDGDFDFGDAPGGDECDRFQCKCCGYTLKENIGYGDNNIIDNEEIVAWCKKNCKQD